MNRQSTCTYHSSHSIRILTKLYQYLFIWKHDKIILFTKKSFARSESPWISNWHDFEFANSSIELMASSDLVTDWNDKRVAVYVFTKTTTIKPQIPMVINIPTRRFWRIWNPGNLESRPRYFFFFKLQLMAFYYCDKSSDKGRKLRFWIIIK